MLPGGGDSKKPDQEHASSLEGEPWPPCLLSHMRATLDLVLLPRGLSSPCLQRFLRVAPQHYMRVSMLFCQDSELRTAAPCGSHRKLTGSPRKKLSSQLCPYLVSLYKPASSEYSLSGRYCAEWPLGLVCALGRLVRRGCSMSAHEESPPGRGGWPGWEPSARGPEQPFAPHAAPSRHMALSLARSPGHPCANI